MCDLWDAICHTKVKQLCSTFLKNSSLTTHHIMPLSNNSMSQQVGTPKLKEEVLKMACVQMLRAVAIMWSHKWLLPDDISCHQKRCTNLLGIYITDMLCHSCVKRSLLREECRPDSRKWQKLSLLMCLLLLINAVKLLRIYIQLYV